MTILVTGSRGKVGSTLIKLLHDKGIDVRAASSNPEKLTVPAGVESMKLALDAPADFPAALVRVTSVFLYAEPSQIGAFIEQAEAAGVEHIVVMSSDSVLRPDAANNPIAAPHLAVERALEASSITTTPLRCGALMSNVLPWSWALKTRGAADLPYPDSYTDPLHERDVAESALAVLTEPQLGGNPYHLTGPESLTFAEQAAIIERAAGRTIPINTVTPAAWMAAKPDYIPQDIADALLDLWAESSLPVTLTSNVEDLTGHPARTFAEWAKENADAFRS